MDRWGVSLLLILVNTFTTHGRWEWRFLLYWPIVLESFMLSDCYGSYREFFELKKLKMLVIILIRSLSQIWMGPLAGSAWVVVVVNRC